MDVPIHRRDERTDETPQIHPTPSAQIFMRNYDPYWEYDLRLLVEAGGSEPVFERRYYFQPGEVKHERDPLPPGEYEVTVELDNRHRKTTRCRVSSAPEDTIHVELGNGVVSVTDGLY